MSCWYVLGFLFVPRVALACIAANYLWGWNFWTAALVVLALLIDGSN